MLLSRRRFHKLMSGVLVAPALLGPSVLLRFVDDSDLLTGYGMEDLCSVVMGFVPADYVKDLRLTRAEFDQYVVRRDLPGQLIQYQPDVDVALHRRDYDAIVDFLMDADRINDLGFIPSDGDEGSIAYQVHKARWYAAETAGRVAFERKLWA